MKIEHNANTAKIQVPEISTKKDEASVLPKGNLNDLKNTDATQASGVMKAVTVSSSSDGFKMDAEKKDSEIQNLGAVNNTNPSSFLPPVGRELDVKA